MCHVDVCTLEPFYFHFQNWLALKIWEKIKQFYFFCTYVCIVSTYISLLVCTIECLKRLAVHHWNWFVFKMFCSWWLLRHYMLLDSLIYIYYTATFKQGSPWGVSNMKAASNGQYYLLKHFFTMLASRSTLWAKKSLKQCFFKNLNLLLILSKSTFEKNPSSL